MAVTAAKLLVVVDGDVSGALKSYDTVSARGKKSAESLSKVGKVMETSIAVGAAAVAVGFGAAIYTTMQFDKRMSAVQAKASASASDLTAMRDAAIDLGSQTVFSASEAADGMEILAAAGMNAKSIITAMPAALSTAAAAGGSFADTADVLVATMGQYNLKASDMGRIGDVLAKSANMSAVSINDMGVSLKYAGPVAAALGISLEETSAALVVLGNNGIKADTAGTALRMGLLALQAPTGKAGKLMKKYGIDMLDAKGKAKPLTGILAELKDSMKGLSQAEKVGLLKKLVGTESVSSFLKLMDAGAEGIGKITTELENAKGSAKAAADVMTNNLWGSIEQLKGGVESAAISIGTALIPQTRALADNLNALVGSFNGMTSEQQQAIIKNLALGASFAVGLLAAIKLGQAILTIRAALIGLQAAAGPVGLLWAAVGLLGGGLAMAGTNALVFSDGMNSTELSARTAADAVKGLKDAIMLLDDANLANREATLGVAVAEAQRAAAHKSVLAALATYGKNSPQYKAALLGEQQSILGVERAEQRRKAATIVATDASRKAADATRKKASADFVATNAGQRYVGALIAQKAAAGEIIPATAKARAAIEKIAAAWYAASLKADGYRASAQRALSAGGPKNAAGKTTQGRTSGIARKADGGFSNGPEQILWGEAGRELILPLTNPSRTDDLLAQAGLSSGGSNVFNINVTTSSDDDRIAMAVKREVRAMFSSSPSLA